MDFLDLVKEKIKEVPIGAWVPYYDKDLILDYLKDIKNVGINYIPARDSKKETLDLIKESGLYAIVNDDRVVYSNIHTLNEIHNYLDDYIDHDAYFMSFIWDEPSPTMMYFSSAILKQVEKAKEKAIGYVNLHPNYSDVITQREGLSYDEYIEHFIKLHNPKVLSFDNYPFYTDKNDLNSYITNLLSISAYSKKYNIPFLFFVQSAGFQSCRNVGFEEMSLLVNLGMGFGAKGYLYFTYAEVTHEEGFKEGLLDKELNKTERYYYAKEINNTIQKNASFFLDSSFVGVKFYDSEFSHLSNIDIPFEVKGNSIMVSVFNYRDKNVYYVVNLDFKANNNFTFNGLEYKIKAGGAVIIR